MLRLPPIKSCFKIRMITNPLFQYNTAFPQQIFAHVGERIGAWAFIPTCSWNYSGGSCFFCTAFAGQVEGDFGKFIFFLPTCKRERLNFFAVEITGFKIHQWVYSSWVFTQSPFQATSCLKKIAPVLFGNGTQDKDYISHVPAS